MAKTVKKRPSLAEELKTGASQLTLGSAAPMAGIGLHTQMTPALAFDAASGGEALEVDSNSFGAGRPIPDVFSGYGESRSPSLRWRGVPEEAASLVVLAEDPDAHADRPFVHWLVYNLPPTVRELPEGVPTTARLPEFHDAVQGRSSRGEIGYTGPRPPKHDPAHHYHFEVFALDCMLNLKPGVDRETVMHEMDGHILASGDLVGTYQAPA